MDANTLHHHKENIQPLPRGRPATKLGLALADGKTGISISKLREAFEAKLQADDLDDPLQVYIDYIDWTHNHYPQGSTGDSGLLKLLERCTSYFRDTIYYKNDPRYLKVWLEYAAYSNLPRDIFVYLAKKEIGVQLALYYEEFARFLEASGAVGDAKQVYEIGLERNARPQPRLARNFDQFQKRIRASDTGTHSDMRAVLSRKVSGSPIGDAPASKRSKVLVFRDDSSPTLKDTVFSRDPGARFGSIAPQRKENVLVARPWAGETQLQKVSTAKGPAKFHVFRDPDPIDKSAPEKEYEVVKITDGYCSVIRQPGKPVETVHVNMDLVYPSVDEEYCFAEILALSRKFSRGKKQALVEIHGEIAGQDELKELVGHSDHRGDNGRISHREKNVDEQNHTFTIPLRDDDTIQRPSSPTMTMFSQMTTKEVLGMFNDAAHDFQLDEESTRGLEESTNYDGFVTETINMDTKEKTVATPPTDHYDSDGSLPFLERPSRMG